MRRESCERVGGVGVRRRERWSNMVGRRMEERDLKKSGGSGQGRGYRLGV
jgi:hypothetical protein